MIHQRSLWTLRPSWNTYSAIVSRETMVGVVLIVTQLRVYYSQPVLAISPSLSLPQVLSVGSAQMDSVASGITFAWPAAKSRITVSAVLKTWRTSAPLEPRWDGFIDWSNPCQGQTLSWGRKVDDAGGREQPWPLGDKSLSPPKHAPPPTSGWGCPVVTAEVRFTCQINVVFDMEYCQKLFSIARTEDNSSVFGFLASSITLQIQDVKYISSLTFFITFMPHLCTKTLKVSQVIEHKILQALLSLSLALKKTTPQQIK